MANVTGFSLLLFVTVLIGAVNSSQGKSIGLLNSY